MTFQQTDLFGGAITVDLPTGFGDVSDIRQVPDNQEVYLDSNGFTSIIFDICERVENAGSDEDALKLHFDDIVAGSAEGSTFWEKGNARLAKMPNTPVRTLLATQHPTPPTPPQLPISTTLPPPRKPSLDFTGIILLLVRLETQKTDIIITVNVPHVAGEYAKNDVDPENGRWGTFMERAVGIRERILSSFEVLDWSLFVNE
ncbi:Mog1p/PsbP-like protein [Lepidopterella palustris CBS 459.81]|uniref:Mog1p/PsbP-like protein n=1 Tax=Lepidopterella palustris CBS 459.81 TaxID=1314670 RepID=A0A8E2E711_9PEZI|nr:Mog1p/PsbP-like protein [Lepidopterella palustris CBS 459.81]